MNNPYSFLCLKTLSLVFSFSMKHPAAGFTGNKNLKSTLFPSNKNILGTTSFDDFTGGLFHLPCSTDLSTSPRMVYGSLATADLTRVPSLKTNHSSKLTPFPPIHRHGHVFHSKEGYQRGEVKGRGICL